MSLKRKLKHSVPLDIGLVSEHPKINIVTDVVLKKLTSNGLSKPKIKKVRSTIKYILLALVKAHRSDPNLYIAISRDNSKYAAGTHYGKLRLKRTYVIAVLDALVECKLIEQHIGHFDMAANEGWATRIKATRNLIRLFDSADLIAEMIKPNPSREVIFLRDKSVVTYEEQKRIRVKGKKREDYEDNEFVRERRTILQILNFLWANNHIDLKISDAVHRKMLRELKVGLKEKQKRWWPGKKKPNPYHLGVVDFTRNQLHRTYLEERWDLGGRFCGAWYQGIPSKYRRYIRINGEPTIELDYKQMHPTLLYSEKGLELIDDPYMLDGFKPTDRSALKETFNCMLNVDDPEFAKLVLKYTLPDRNLPKPYKTKDDVFEAFKKKHKPIADAFFSNCGIRLQNRDAQIAEDVLKIMMLEHGVICLPVHDSFIVPIQYEILLLNTMEEVFKLHTGVTPQIKHDKTFLTGKPTRPDSTFTTAILLDMFFPRKADPMQNYNQRKYNWDLIHNPKSPTIEQIWFAEVSDSGKLIYKELDEHK